jgi:hypothetical protein
MKVQREFMNSKQPAMRSLNILFCKNIVTVN